MARKSNGLGEREGRRSGGVGRGPHGRRGRGGQGWAAALNAWPEGEARPVASAGVPSLPEPPRRCVWSATSWACASIHGALKRGRGEGSTRGSASPFTHTRTLACTPRPRGQGSGPAALQLGVLGERERGTGLPPGCTGQGGGGGWSLLASRIPGHIVSPQSLLHARALRQASRPRMTSWEDAGVCSCLGSRQTS